MPIKYFAPRTPDRAGAVVEAVSTETFRTITASATTTSIASSPFRKSWIERVYVTVGSVPPVFAALGVTVNKRRGATTTPLTASFSLLSLTQYTTFNIPMLASLTEAQRTLLEGDVLEFNIVATTATTQPSGGLNFGAELLVRE